MSFKASDLVKSKQKSDDMSEYNYRVLLDKCYVHIKNIHQNCKNDSFTFFNIPVILYDDPYYNFEKCKEYITRKLKENEFYVETSASDLGALYISWKKQDVEQVKQELYEKHQARIQQETRRQQEQDAIERKRKEQQIKWKPSSAISEMRMKSTLMKDNPKYAHLNSVKGTVGKKKKK